MEILNQYLFESDCPILVAFSGGKDSIACVLHLLEMGIAKSRIELHHRDVDGGAERLFDWPCTQSYISSFADYLGLRLFVSYREGGILSELFRKDKQRENIHFQTEPGGPMSTIYTNPKYSGTRLKFPSVSANLTTRWCSGTVKIDVLRSVICHNPNYQKQILIVSGERAQESPNRAKMNFYQISKVNAKSRPALHWHPILYWKEDQVWDILKRSGIQPHPAYMIGWNRCSCQLCIFNHGDLWASIAEMARPKIDRIAEIESKIGHTLYHGMTIEEKVQSGTAISRSVNIDPYWVDQANGQFTAPIYVPTDSWEYPPGAFNSLSAGSS